MTIETAFAGTGCINKTHVIAAVKAGVAETINNATTVKGL